MSVDVKDHRKYTEGRLAQSIKEAEARLEAKKELLPQADSQFATTGDDKLDKLIRAIQEVLNTAEQHVAQVANAGVACINDDLFRKHQAEYFFVQGKIATYKEVVEMVARIVTEAKQSQALHIVP